MLSCSFSKNFSAPCGFGYVPAGGGGGAPPLPWTPPPPPLKQVPGVRGTAALFFEGLSTHHQATSGHKWGSPLSGNPPLLSVCFGQPPTPWRDLAGTSILLMCCDRTSCCAPLGCWRCVLYVLVNCTSEASCLRWQLDECDGSGARRICMIRHKAPQCIKPPSSLCPLDSIGGDGDAVGVDGDGAHMKVGRWELDDWRLECIVVPGIFPQPCQRASTARLDSSFRGFYAMVSFLLSSAPPLHNRLSILWAPALIHGLQ